MAASTSTSDPSTRSLRSPQGPPGPEELSLVSELRAMYRISGRSGSSQARSGGVPDTRRGRRPSRTSSSSGSMPPPTSPPSTKRRRGREQGAGATYPSHSAETQLGSPQPMDVSGPPMGPGPSSSWPGSSSGLGAGISSSNNSLSSPQSPYLTSTEYFASGAVPAYGSSSLPPHLRAAASFTQAGPINQPPGPSSYYQAGVNRPLEGQSQMGSQAGVTGEFYANPAQFYTQAQMSEWQAPIGAQQPHFTGRKTPQFS